jgi:hypothetical protein
MAYSRFMDEEVLRRVIRRKLQSGRLPYDGIRTVWSTPSDGETCDACDTVLTRNQLLMEAVLLGLGKRSIRMHVRCFQIWDFEKRRTFKPNAAGGGND